MKDKQIAAPEFQGHPLTAAELQNVIKVKPVKNMRSLIVTFPFPDYNPYYMAQPQRYLSHLIGHESEGKN